MDRLEGRGEPALSLVVVAYEMARELPRTLASLAPGHQQGIGADDYEVVVVDNGSTRPIEPPARHRLPHLRVLRIDDAPASPVLAANRGLAEATGDLIGLIVDGARLASPGLLATARRAGRLHDRPVITAPAFHLGTHTHMHAAEVGYDQAAEDELLAGSDWEADGYRLFEVATPAGSSGRGLFGPMGESSSLFMPRALWEELEGLDDRFVLPGGGLVNHDLFHRACHLPDVDLIVLLGEATFHQHHGGVATSRRLGWEEMHEEYQRLRGASYSPPATSPTYLGRVPEAALGYVERSARQARDRLANAAAETVGVPSSRSTAPGAAHYDASSLIPGGPIS